MAKLTADPNESLTRGNIAEFITPIITNIVAQVVTSAIQENNRYMASKEDLKAFATRDDLKAFANKDDLKDFATKKDLIPFATKDDIKQLPTKDNLHDAIVASERRIKVHIGNEIRDMANASMDHTTELIQRQDSKIDTLTKRHNALVRIVSSKHLLV